jgi:hypothetical protein
MSRTRGYKYVFVALIILGLAVAILGFVLTRPAIDKGEPVQPPQELQVTFVPTPPVLYEYIEVIDGCGPYWGEGCLNVRSGPGEEYPKVAELRTGVVLKVGEKIINDEGRAWYRIVFDEWLRYPERVTGEWYVAADYVKSFFEEGPSEFVPGETPSTTKHILVDRSEQMLYAYDGDELFAKEPISTGLAVTPTPRGSFIVYRKTPSRYMQGPLPGISAKYYDLPGVPWNLFFTHEGAVVHGAYWHDKFGQVWSSGCVNLMPGQAKKLYEWAELGMAVVVRD